MQGVTLTDGAKQGTDSKAEQRKKDAELAEEKHLSRGKM